MQCEDPWWKVLPTLSWLCASLCPLCLASRCASAQCSSWSPVTVAPTLAPWAPPATLNPPWAVLCAPGLAALPSPVPAFISLDFCPDHSECPELGSVEGPCLTLLPTSGLSPRGGQVPGCCASPGAVFSGVKTSSRVCKEAPDVVDLRFKESALLRLPAARPWPGLSGPCPSTCAALPSGLDPWVWSGLPCRDPGRGRGGTPAPECLPLLCSTSSARGGQPCRYHMSSRLW